MGFSNFCCFQVKLSEKASLLETAEGKIAELTAEVNEQQKLIQKLEDDILKVRICDFFEIPCSVISLYACFMSSLWPLWYLGGIFIGVLGY